MLKPSQRSGRCHLMNLFTYHTTSGISAAIASSIPAAARGGLSRPISWISGSFSLLMHIGGLRDEDGRRRCTSFSHGICDSCEYWQTEMCRSSFLRIRSSNHRRTYSPVRKAWGCRPNGNTYHSQLLVARENCDLNLSMYTRNLSSITYVPCLPVKP